MIGLVGHTGFVGSNLKNQNRYDLKFNSSNFKDIPNYKFKELWFSGLPAAKWIANKNPEDDWNNINEIMNVLSETEVERFILISTIDIYNDSEPYGLHRKKFEEFVTAKFNNHHIIRLPALFGENLKKNIIYDLLNDNCIDNIHEDDVYQWYSLTDLTNDIKIIIESDTQVADLFPEPIGNKEILKLFPKVHIKKQQRPSRIYSFKSNVASMFNSDNKYMRDQASILKKLKVYIANYRN